MYISTVLFIIIFVLDICAGYSILGPTGALIVAIGLPIGIIIQQKLAIYQADAVRLEDLSPSDRAKLSIAFENVLQSAESIGYTFRRNPRIYLSEDDSMNGFNAGNAIVINRGLMNSGCLEGICAHEIKHWRYKDSYTLCLICNTVTILSLLCLFVLSIYVFAIALFIGIVIAVISSGTAGVIVGSLIGRFLGKIKDLVLRANLFIMNFLQSVLSRYIEYKADEWATRIGYGEQLKQFLRLTFESRRLESLSARLLSSHPSDSKRIGHIQHIQNQMNERGELVSLPFDV
ncbi:M48 family metalloprotease [Ruminococcus sp.]|uniref:M48 family metalloprotease n=1 Tax=Ruminococcus sp. TaxID=41978 RepID=UPI0025F84578|nr:M48 family metalloprotease [Ruminococcus sp.]MBR1432658.1 M48 family metalloprotease [Ruminococcus sp.]